MNFISRRIPALLIAVVTVVVALLVVGVALYLGRSSMTSKTSVGNQNVNRLAEAPLLSSVWQFFYARSLEILTPFPTGMNPCTRDATTVTFQNESCTIKGKATFTFRKNATWDTLDRTVAFDAAFAQQLREAGLDSIGSRGTAYATKDVSVLSYTFSDTFTGLMLAEVQRDGSLGKKVALEVQRDIQPHITKGIGELDEVIEAIAKDTHFLASQNTTPSPSTNTP